MYKETATAQEGLSLTLLALKMKGDVHQPRNMGTTPRGQKGQETDSPPDPLKSNTALLTP